MPNTLRKSERLDKKKVIEKMFAGGSRFVFGFPFACGVSAGGGVGGTRFHSCKCLETPFQAGGEAQPRETPDT